MPKIQGWSKVGEDAWQGPKNDDRFMVEIQERKLGIGGYRTVYEVQLTGAKNRVLADFDTKQEARRFVVEWMRMHPGSVR